MHDTTTNRKCSVCLSSLDRGRLLVQLPPETAISFFCSFFFFFFERNHAKIRVSSVPRIAPDSRDDGATRAFEIEIIRPNCTARRENQKDTFCRIVRIYLWVFEGLAFKFRRSLKTSCSKNSINASLKCYDKNYVRFYMGCHLYLYRYEFDINMNLS